ncbi:MAG: 2-C-methyl-D-erythritol 2,4-cyclodiphosphate synthase [Planctomycetaceae bacterium]|jgi:2-C-methyl-D-erythritol 2,4-cyclodiphosphate synthase|nr:2-C-methyl-D-erythritol 2,4-cyclodiphosphate synthase [Planctomycetaceae bacterium]
MYRIGIGHDTHRLEPGNGLWLGGLKIPHSKSAVGHSDADVLLHAVTDALLGAATLGDIGELFPDDDPENKDRPSSSMLAVAMDKVQGSGWNIVNMDCIIFAQKPKILPHREEIRRTISGLLSLDINQIWIKAKTGEAVGPIGEERAIAAECVVLLETQAAFNKT